MPTENLYALGFEDGEADATNGSVVIAYLIEYDEYTRGYSDAVAEIRAGEAS